MTEQDGKPKTTRSRRTTKTQDEGAPVKRTRTTRAKKTPVAAAPEQTPGSDGSGVGQVVDTKAPPPIDLKKLPELKTWKEKIQQVHEYSSKADFYANQYEQVGELVDMWGDLFEGYAPQAPEYGALFEKLQTQRSIPDLSIKWEKLYATGFVAPSRWMQFYQRSPVTVAVFVAKQGSDLYISWRAFVQAKISEARIAIWLIISAVLALPFSFSTDMFLSDPTFEIESFAIAAAIIAAIIGGIGAGMGVYYRKGDYLALLREPLNELQYDDVTALTNSIHASLIQAANQLNIDTKKFEAREPFYKARRTSRF